MAPDALADDLASALELIANQPGVGAAARNLRLARVQRLYLHRVRYFLYYRVTLDQPEIVQVVAFWHASRGSGPRG